MALSWIVAGGGTGGHVTPALALGEAIVARGDRVLFVGSEHGLEARLVPAAGFELVSLPSQQVMGRGLLGRLRGVLSILGAVGPARRALGGVGADIVLTVGGYAAMPVVLAAWLTRTPLALINPDSIPGRVNRLSAPLAKRIYVGFESAAERLSSRRVTARFTGIPLRASMIEAFAGRTRRRPEPPFHLLVAGGSQGARQLNDAMMDALPRLADQPLEVFHQSGAADRERVAEAYAKAGVAAEVVAFASDMPARYAWADLALCRVGAVTCAELALSGLPALLVPYPHAADDHQTVNAAELEAAGAARRLDPATLDGPRVVRELCELFEAPDVLTRMSEAATRRARPRAASEIVEDCAALTDPAGDRR